MMGLCERFNMMSIIIVSYYSFMLHECISFASNFQCPFKTELCVQLLLTVDQESLKTKYFPYHLYELLPGKIHDLCMKPLCGTQRANYCS